MNFFITLFLSFLLLCFCSESFAQTQSPVKKYDELLAPIPQAQIENIETTKQEKDELVLLLPKLDSTLYGNWSPSGEPLIWKITEDGPNFEVASLDILLGAGIEKILKQTYKKDNHLVNILIYKLNNFAGAYSASTVLHKGAPTKLMDGKNASEANNLVNFWKGNYFVDIHTAQEDDKTGKEFATLFSQDISKNINVDSLPPVVAIQLPALNRIQGSEKYCLDALCFSSFFPHLINELGPEVFQMPESGGIITAEYQAFGISSFKDKEKITLLLGRYLKNETAEIVFNKLKDYYEKKKEGNKDIDLDFDVEDWVVAVKVKKTEDKKDNYTFTMFKRKGNILAIAFGVNSKKSGEQILNLVPWPIEITKPINTQN